jgi:hypothetical protein
MIHSINFSSFDQVDPKTWAQPPDIGPSTPVPKRRVIVSGHSALAPSFPDGRHNPQ